MNDIERKYLQRKLIALLRHRRGQRQVWIRRAHDVSAVDRYRAIDSMTAYNEYMCEADKMGVLIREVEDFIDDLNILNIRDVLDSMYYAKVPNVHGVLAPEDRNGR